MNALIEWMKDLIAVEEYDVPVEPAQEEQWDLQEVLNQHFSEDLYFSSM
jgi:hypothetical protein